MASIQQTLLDFSSGFSVAEGLNFIGPLFLFIVGLGVYSWFIFKFYRFVARKDMFMYGSKKSSEEDHGFMKKIYHGISYVFKYVVLFPLITVFWALVLSVILAFLSKSGNMSSILLVSMSLIGIVRVASYFSEDLSKDLSKMLPFALLGVFIIDVSFFSIEGSIDTLLQLPSLWNVAVYYLMLIIILEFVLRILSFFFFRSKSSTHTS